MDMCNVACRPDKSWKSRAGQIFGGKGEHRARERDIRLIGRNGPHADGIANLQTASMSNVNDLVDHRAT